MDSASDAALHSGAELIVHAYPDGRAPGRERLLELGLEHLVVPAPATSQDVAMLLAHEKGASLIVAVGAHFNLTEFLDKNRAGMSSTFLTRLRVGETLVDAKGVSSLYNPGIAGSQVALFAGRGADPHRDRDPVAARAEQPRRAPLAEDQGAPRPLGRAHGLLVALPRRLARSGLHRAGDRHPDRRRLRLRRARRRGARSRGEPGGRPRRRQRQDRGARGRRRAAAAVRARRSTRRSPRTPCWDRTSRWSPSADRPDAIREDVAQPRWRRPAPR